MATIAVTEANFNEIADEGIVLLDFWAAWCGPCRTFGPIFEKVSQEHQDITFGKIDTEAERGLAEGFDINAIPTVMAIRDGIVVYAQSGALPAPALQDLIKQVRALDMDAIRKEIADDIDSGRAEGPKDGRRP